MNMIDIKSTRRFFSHAAMLMVGLALSLPVFADDAFVTEQHGARVVDLEGGRNFRDLGGYETADGRQVKPGLLFRSGILTNLTESDYEIITSLGIETIVDFRTQQERYSEPTFWRGGPVQVFARDYDMGLNGAFLEPFMDPFLDLEAAESVMASMYPVILNQQNESYRAMFDALIDNEAPLLFHCTAGKDRTGIAAALVLTALGVDHDTVVADFVVSEKILGDALLVAAGPSNTHSPLAMLPAPAIEALMGTRRSYIEAAFSAMERKSGSVRAYLHEELGLSDQDLAVLRNHYLQ